MIQTRIFSHNSAMTFTLDPKTWFKVTAQSLTKETLWVKFKPDQKKGREDILQRSDIRWTNGQMEKDRQMYKWTDGKTYHNSTFLPVFFLVSDTGTVLFILHKV